MLQIETNAEHDSCLGKQLRTYDTKRALDFVWCALLPAAGLGLTLSWSNPVYFLDPARASAKPAEGKSRMTDADVVCGIKIPGKKLDGIILKTSCEYPTLWQPGDSLKRRFGLRETCRESRRGASL